MRKALLLAALTALTVSCTKPEPITRVDLLAFSTTVSFSVYAPPPHFHEEVIPLLEQRLAELDRQWKSFGNGALGTLNATLEQAGCSTTDDATFSLIETALRLSRRSNGLFDPTLGLEVDSWGFRDYAQTSRAVPPTTKGTVTLDGNRICTDAPVRIDLGGIAKGAIVKELALVLDQHGVRNAVINTGGDLLVLGRAGDRNWRVAIQHPRKAGVIAMIEAAPGDAVFSSGDYYRSEQIDGQLSHHILDPRTGAPARGAIATTIIHSDPLLADAAATALLVAGAPKFVEVATAMGVKRAVIIDQNGDVLSLANTNLNLPATVDVTPQDKKSD